jgi:molybdopterin converting factor small subunit
MSNEPGITITVRLYSILRERDNRTVDRLELELPPDSRISDVLRLLEVARDLEVVLATNDEIAMESAVLHDGDRLAIIPAVAGGTKCL